MNHQIRPVRLSILLSIATMSILGSVWATFIHAIHTDSGWTAVLGFAAAGSLLYLTMYITNLDRYYSYNEAVKKRQEKDNV